MIACGFKRTPMDMQPANGQRRRKSVLGRRELDNALLLYRPASKNKKYCVHTVSDSRREIAFTKGGKDILVDYVFGDLVSQNRLKPRAHLDADLMFVWGNHKKHAVMLIVCADAPIISEPETIILNAVAS